MCIALIKRSSYFSKKLNMKQNLVVVGFFMSIIILIGALSSCEKDGYGYFIVAVSNSTANSSHVSIQIDDESKGSMIIQPYQQVTTSGLCSDKVYAAQLDNVYVLSYVPSGNHVLKLVDTSTGQVLGSKNIVVVTNNCSQLTFLW